jgi:hypothetical protein
VLSIAAAESDPSFAATLRRLDAAEAAQEAVLSVYLAHVVAGASSARDDADSWRTLLASYVAPAHEATSISLLTEEQQLNHPGNGQAPKAQAQASEVTFF